MENLDISTTLEDKIAEIMEENGQTIVWLSRKTGLSVGHLHNIIKGKGISKRRLTERNKAKISAALKINL